MGLKLSSLRGFSCVGFRPWGLGLGFRRCRVWAASVSDLRYRASGLFVVCRRCFKDILFHLLMSASKPGGTLPHISYPNLLHDDQKLQAGVLAL